MYDSTLSLLVDVRVGGFIYVTSSERISLPWRWEIEEKMSGGKKEVGRGGGRGLSALVPLRQLAFGLCLGNFGDELDLVGHILELRERTVQVGRHENVDDGRQPEGQRKRVGRQGRERRNDVRLPRPACFPPRTDILQTRVPAPCRRSGRARRPRGGCGAADGGTGGASLACPVRRG